MPLGVGDHFGPYDIVSELGAGGMGVVFRARDTRLGRDVAIKTLPPESANDPVRLQRFQQEAQAASALNHPNVLAVYDVGEERGTPYLVTELLEGQSLRDHLRQGRLSARRAVEITVQVAAGLDAVHQKGIVHRDLKPDNLFLTGDGRVKILDFGVARVLGTDTPPASRTLALTESGAVMGTAGYMSPEQVRGKPADIRSDLFALGAILYEMLAGHLAFPGETPVERGYAILNQEPLELAPLGVPPALERVLRRCLEKNPEQRFQHARDLAFALEAITDPSGRAAILEAPPPRRRTPLPRALVPALGVLLFAGGGVWVGLRLRAASAVPAREASDLAINRVSFRNGTIVSARFASDGRGLVYAGAFEGEPLQVYAGALDGAALRPVVEPFTTLFDVSPTDELAVGALDREPGSGRGRVLSRVPLGGGTPRPLLEGVTSADFAQDGPGLLVTRATGAGTTVELAGRVIASTAEQFDRARLSPNGTLVAYERHPVPHDDRGHVEIVDLNGRTVARSRDAWSLRGLAWAPGGTEAWFTAADRSTQRSIRALSVDGRERRVFGAPGTLILHDIDAKGRTLVALNMMRFRLMGRVAGSDRERSLGWLDGSSPADLSADGRVLLFAEGFGANHAEIETWLRTFDGTPPVSLSTGWPRALSPDRKWAVVSPTPPFASLTLVPTGPGSPRPLTAGSFGTIERARYFPDGTRLLIAATNAQGQPRLYVQSLQTEAGPGGTWGDVPRQLCDEDLETWAPPSPDGRTVAAMQPTGVAVLLAVDSGKVSPLPTLERGDRPLQWTSDGKGLLVGRRKSAEEPLLVTVLRLDLVTGALKELYRLGPTDTVGISKLENGVMTPDGTHYAYEAAQYSDELYVIDGLR